MRAHDPIESIASAVYTALANPLILPDIEYERNKYSGGGIGKRRPVAEEVSVYHFPQTWGSTALGFGGMGGSVMTTAYTTVVISGNAAAVFFGGRHAYSLSNISAEFMEDVRNHRTLSVDKAKKYEQ